MVFVTDFEELCTTALVVIHHYLKLGHSFFAHLAHPVVDFLVWAVLAATVRQVSRLEDFGRPTKALQQVGLLLGWPIEQRQRFG